ncbi:MAG: DUF2225 domain-containing protein [bacterium]|nr:DUF2225 domain-containing protein [bacterium]
MNEDVKLESIDCPVCRKKFDVEYVEKDDSAVIFKDSDFMESYKGVNPELYAIYVCPKCFYAAFREDFLNIPWVVADELNKRKEERKTIVKNADFSKKRNLYLALLSYEVAVACYKLRKNTSEKIADIMMKAAWLARDMNSWQLEKDFLNKALVYYVKAFENERNTRMNQTTSLYIIGEINRRLGNYEEAKKYLSWAFSNKIGEEDKIIKTLAHAQYSIVKEILEKKRKPEPADQIEILRKIDFLSPLSEEELRELSNNLEWKLYPKGKSIIKQDEGGSSFFIIKEGEVEVIITTKGKSKVIATLKNNDYFGEMSLLTGKKRIATVKTIKETEVFSLKKDKFASILLNNPSIANKISRILVEREEKLGIEIKEMESKSWEILSMLLQIKNFFSIEE